MGGSNGGHSEEERTVGDEMESRGRGWDERVGLENEFHSLPDRHTVTSPPEGKRTRANKS